MDKERILMLYESYYEDFHRPIIPFAGYKTILPGVQGDRDCCFYIYKNLEGAYRKGDLISQAKIFEAAQLSDCAFSEYNPDRFCEAVLEMSSEEQNKLIEELKWRFHWMRGPFSF